MVQMAGSHHDWFEGRRGWAVLMVMIDDATNRSYVRFFEEETTAAAMTTFSVTWRVMVCRVLCTWIGTAFIVASGRPRWLSKWRARSPGRSLDAPWKSWEWS